MQMLAGMVEVQQLMGPWPALLDQAPAPLGSISRAQNVLGAAQPGGWGLPMQPPAQFASLALPAHYHFVLQRPAAVLGAGTLLMAVKDAHLHFVPFHTGFLGFLFAPARATVAHQPGVDLEHGQSRGCALRLLFFG